MDNLSRFPAFSNREIDENLCRIDLTPAEEADHLKRRKELFDQKGVTICDTLGGPQKTGFDADTAKKTGKTKQDVNRKRTRAEKIAPDGTIGAVWGVP